MKPHMRHIAHTLARKAIVEDALNQAKDYRRYKDLVEQCLARGMSQEQIIEGLEEERQRVQEDEREGDPLFQIGLKNVKESCTKAINLLISELKGETHHG